MTASGARRTDASGTCERPEPSARPARAGSFNPFGFLSLARLPRPGTRGGLAAALVLLALSAFVPAGSAQAQSYPQFMVLTPLPEGNALRARWNAVTLPAATYAVRLFDGSTEIRGIGKGTGENSHTFGGLTAGKLYRVVVQTHTEDGAIVSGSTAEATATPLLPPVTNFSIAPSSKAGQDLGTVLKATWNAVSGADNYLLQLKAAGTGNWINAAPGNTTTYDIIGLTAGTNYAVRVRAENSGTGAESVWTTGYALTSTLLAPKSLSVTTFLSARGHVQLQWTAVTPLSFQNPVTRYVIEYWSGSELDPGDSGTLAVTGSSTQQGKVTGLRPSTEYTFRIHAVLKDGSRTPTSNTVTYTTPAADSGPRPPTSVTATVESWDTISVSWVANAGGNLGAAGVTGYDVEFQSPHTQAPWKAVPVIRNRDGTVRHDVTKSTLTVYSHGSLSPNTWHRYRVRAKNGLNGGSNSGWTYSTSAVSSNGVDTHAKPFGFDYDITERYGADGLEVPRDKQIGFGYSSTAIAIRLPQLLDGRTPVPPSDVTYTLFPARGGSLPAWLRFNRSTRILETLIRDSRGQLFKSFESDLPLTLNWKAAARGQAFTQTFTLTYEAAGASGNSGEEPSRSEPPGAVGDAEGTPPTAEAGAALTGKRGGDVKLKGLGTKHAQGSQDALSYSWRIAKASHPELKAGTSWLRGLVVG